MKTAKRMPIESNSLAAMIMSS